MTVGSRRRLRFVVLFLPLSLVLSWPFAFVGRNYSSLVCGAINALVLKSTRTPRVARLVPDRRPGAEWHAFYVVWNQVAKATEEQFDIDIHQLFYLPAAFFTALTLAARFAWSSKHVIAKLLLGLALFHLRAMLPFIVQERAVIGVADHGWFDPALLLVIQVVVKPLGMAYALPLLLWFGLFRGSILSTPLPGATSAPSR
jgi:hypothetical protein